jgi:hypothetical protein
MELSTVFGFYSYEQLKEQLEAATLRVEQDKKKLKDSIVALASELSPERQKEVLNMLSGKHVQT